MLSSITTELVFSYLLVFCRLGATIMLLPGFSERYINFKARLTVALLLSLILVPILRSKLPAFPDTATMLTGYIFKELLIGFFIGAIAKILFLTLSAAGLIIASNIGLNASMFFNPATGTQESEISTFLSMAGIMLIFATNTHHIFIKTLIDSYELFLPGVMPEVSGFSKVITETVSSSFSLALRLSAPLIVISLIVYLAGGIIGRLMPQIQVFFILLPIQILLGFVVLMFAMGTGLSWFINNYVELFTKFL